MQAIWQELIRLGERGEPAALCTIVKTQGSTPGKQAMKMLVRADGSILGTVGGGCLEAEVLEAALEAMADDRPTTLAFALNERDYPDSGLVCGGRLEIYVEPIVEPRLFIFGGGHVAEALTRIATMVGFHVTVADDRPAFANPERHPEAAATLAGPWDRAVAAALEAGPGGLAQRYVVVATRGHQDDEDILRGLAEGLGAGSDGGAPRYLGMIGSRAKRVTIFKNLRAAGVPEAFLEAVRTPMGLDIGARTHEEIAVSVVAELVQLRRGTPGPAR